MPWVAMRLAAQALEFIGWVMIARRFTPEIVGEVTVAYLVCRYVGLVADWGAIFGGTRLAARDPDDPRIRALAVRRQKLTLVLGPLLAGMFLFLGHGELIALVAVVAYRGSNREWLALGRGAHVAGGLPPVVAGLGFLIGGALAGSTGGLVACIALAQAVGVGLSLFLTRLPSTSNDVRPSLDGWLMVVTLSDQLYITSDSILLAVLRSSREAGIYSTLYRFPAAWTAVVGLIALGSLPHVTRDVGRASQLATALRRGALLGGGLLAVTPVVYLAVWTTLGPEFTAEVAVIVLLTIALAIASAGAPLATLFLAQRPDRELALATLGVGITNVAANLALIPRFGMPAAALTTALSYVALGAFYLRRVR